MSALARPAAGTRGVVNYMAAGVTPSLYRNGRVLTRRDADGSDGGSEGIDVARVEVEIRDARSLAGDRQCTLHDNGFELLQRPLAAPVDFFDHDAVVRGYYADCAATVEAATGARAWAFDHNVRSATGKRQQTRIRGGQQVQGPAHMVHGDYTLHSAPQRLRDLTRPPALNDTLRGVLEPGAALLPEDIVNTAIEGGRFAIINVWRNIAAAPVATHPLALCGAGRSGGGRDPLGRSHRRELLRAPRARARLVLLPRHRTGRGAAHQAVGLCRRTGAQQRCAR